MFKLNEEQLQRITARMEAIELEIQGLQRGLGLKSSPIGSAETGFIDPSVPLLDSLKQLHITTRDEEREKWAAVEARLTAIRSCGLVTVV